MYRWTALLLFLGLSQSALADLIVGYGKMNVDKIYVADNVQYADGPTPDAIADKTWNTVLIGIGGNIRRSSFGLTADFLLSESKKLADVGTRPLVGGGSTRVTKNVSHFGLFLGLRFNLIDVFVLSTGAGVIDQEAHFTYDPPVANPGGAAVDEYFHGNYLGVDLIVTDRIMLGARKYNMDHGVALTTYNLTASF